MTKANKLTDGSNMMWHTRMMLPEHVQAINEHQHQLKRRERITLDESEWERISMAVAESKELRKEIRIQMYDSFEHIEVIGIVDRVDQHGSRFMVDGEWFNIKDIEGAHLNDRSE